ncbi:MAG: sterol desaturase family protein [Parcubacteria group bacterium]
MEHASLLREVLERTGLIATLLALIVALEVRTRCGDYSLKSRLRGVAIHLTATMAGAVTAWFLKGVWQSVGRPPLFTVPLGHWLHWAGPFGILLSAFIALLVTDFFGYWYHRIQHTLLWPVHAVHHSVEELHSASSYGHFSDELFRFIFMAIPMSLMPVDAADLPILGLLITVSQFYIHSPTKLHFGPLRRVFTDNRYHRIHHSLEPRHFNRNFGTTFTVWDQVFGTAYFPQPDEWPDTGLDDMREPRTLWEWATFPIRFLRRADAAGPVREAC